MREPAGKPFSVRLQRLTHAPLCAVAKHHRRSQAGMIDWLVAEELERLIAAGKIKPGSTTESARDPNA